MSRELISQCEYVLSNRVLKELLDFDEEGFIANEYGKGAPDPEHMEEFARSASEKAAERRDYLQAESKVVLDMGREAFARLAHVLEAAIDKLKAFADSDEQVDNTKNW